MDEQYEKMMAEIDRNIAHSGDRINGLAGNVNRALNMLKSKRMPPRVRDVVLAFEAFSVESLWRAAWLLHQRGERFDHASTQLGEGLRPLTAGARCLQALVEVDKHSSLSARSIVRAPRFRKPQEAAPGEVTSPAPRPRRTLGKHKCKNILALSPYWRGHLS